MAKIKIKRHEYKDVAGSRNVVKGRSENNHYYASDIWSEYARRLEGLIPENAIIYGELIGWVDENTPIQRGYTYNLPPGQCEMYVYRVAFVNPKGVLADLSWQGVKDFCASLGLKYVPELDSYAEKIWTGGDEQWISSMAAAWLDTRYADNETTRYIDPPVPLSDKKTVDEGICVRIEGQIPRVLKAKSPQFLEFETKSLDTGDVDMESAA